jgi:hypothetical protein
MVKYFNKLKIKAKMERSVRLSEILNKALVKIVLVAVIFVGLGFFFVFFPAKRLIASAGEMAEEARALAAAAKEQNLSETRKKLKSAREKLKKTQQSLAYFSLGRFIPFLGNYYRDADRLIKAGMYGLTAGEVFVETLEPYTDILGLSEDKGSFVELSAEERLMTVVQTLDKVAPKLDEVGVQLGLAQAEIDEINPARYPSMLGEIPLQGKIERLKELVNQMGTLFVEARPLIEVLPSLLGEPDAKKYLVLFQNDKELRPTGGFLTAYAIFRLEHGKIIAEESHDIYKLDESIVQTFPAPEPIVKYLPKVHNWYIRDTNLSPDFYVSMQKFEEFYQYAALREDIDGIVAIDTYVLQRLIDILAPVEAFGIQFTNEIVPECNCPHVIYELEKYADQPVGYMRSERKGIIGVLMDAIMHKALAISPGQFWPKLVRAGLEILAEKHVLLFLHDKSAQEAVGKLGFAGRIKDFEGDYLHINDANFGGAKSNMYVKHEVEQKVTIDDEGTVIKTLTLKYRNPEPPDDCSLERKTGLCLSATLRNWIRIYVPRGSTLIDAKGSQVEVKTKEDLGKTYFEGFFEVRPLGSAQFVVKYKLPFTVKKGEEYRFLVQKQPGTEGHEYRIMKGEEVIEEFKLTTDKEIKFRI